MRRTVLASVAALLLAGCGPEPAPAPAPAPPPATAPAASPTPYPLNTCIVSDEALGSMGDPVVFTHEGAEIRLCCAACRKAFDKDPAHHMAKLAAARAAKPAGR